MQFLIVAGGLALVLSRHSAEGIRTSYPATNELYLLLRRELARHGRTSASAELLNDVMHETAEETDPATRQALRACFDARLAYEARRRSGGNDPQRRRDAEVAAGQGQGAGTLH